MLFWSAAEGQLKTDPTCCHRVPDIYNDLKALVAVGCRWRNINDWNTRTSFKTATLGVSAVLVLIGLVIVV